LNSEAVISRRRGRADWPAGAAGVGRASMRRSRYRFPGAARCGVRAAAPAAWTSRAIDQCLPSRGSAG